MIAVRSKRAERRKGVSESTITKLFRRVTKYGRQGKISRMCAAFTAAPAAGGNSETLAKLRKLSPDRFVPLRCPRRARIAERVQKVSAAARVKFEEEHLVPAVYSNRWRGRRAEAEGPQAPKAG